jgi:putative salt-induced outer membrane protein YdiY
LAALVVGLAAAGQARADDVYFKDGDHLSGTIVTAGDGKMTVMTATIGQVVIDMKDVKTFSTNEPIKLQLQDGTVIDQKVAQGPDGAVMTAPGGAIAPQAVPLDRVEKINAPPPAWTGAIVINGTLTQSTTDTETFGASINAERRSDVDRLIFGAAYLYGRQKLDGTSTTNEDNWYVQGTYDYFLDKQFYAYGNGRVEQNRIEFLNLRLTPGAGVGYQWAESPRLNFTTDAGMAWVYQDYSSLPAPSEQVSLRLAYHVDATLFDSKFKVFNDVQYFPSIQNVSNYLILTDVGIRLALTKTMFSELKSEVDYNSQPAPGSHRTYVQYILGVGWTF